MTFQTVNLTGSNRIKTLLLVLLLKVYSSQKNELAKTILAV